MAIGQGSSMIIIINQYEQNNETTNVYIHIYIYMYTYRGEMWIYWIQHSSLFSIMTLFLNPCAAMLMSFSYQDSIHPTRIFSARSLSRPVLRGDLSRAEPVADFVVPARGGISDFSLVGYKKHNIYIGNDRVNGLLIFVLIFIHLPLSLSFRALSCHTAAKFTRTWR